MSFGDFARNYLNPFFLLWRFGLLWCGGAAIIFGILVEGLSIFRAIPIVLGIWLCWIGIKPWGDGRGKSINDLNQDLQKWRDRK